MGSYHVSNGRYQSNGSMLTIGEYTQTIDNFERPPETLESIYTGDLNYFDIQSSLVSDGSQALGQTDRNDHRTITSLPGDGLNYYPQPGDRFRFQIAVQQNRSDAWLAFFKSDYQRNTQYEFHLSKYGDAIALWAKPEPGDKEQLAYEFHKPVLDRYYEFEVDSKLDSGDVVLDLTARHPNGSVLLSETVRDSKYTYTGSGIRWTSYKQAAFDHARTV